MPSKALQTNTLETILAHTMIFAICIPLLSQRNQSLVVTSYTPLSTSLHEEMHYVHPSDVVSNFSQLQSEVAT